MVVAPIGQAVRVPDPSDPHALAPLLADLADEQAALDAVVAPLPAERWDLATPAPGWAVRHQVGHLTYFDEQAALARTDPAAYEAGRDAALADRASFDTAGPYAEEPAADLLARWRAARAALGAAFVGADPKDRLPWYGPPMSARSFLTARLMEAWAHGVDVTDALGLPPASSDRLRHVAHLAVVTRGWSYAVRGAEAPAAEVHVAVEAPGGGTWTWGDPGAADRIEGPALDLCLVATQRRAAADTALVATGEAAAGWLAVAQAFAGVATTVRRT
jgi:uncharacterized protein (TIGR03084 family)